MNLSRISALLNSSGESRLDSASASLQHPQGSASVDSAQDVEVSSPYVFIPAHPIVRAGEIVIAYEGRELSSGHWVIPVFSDEDKIIDQLGDAQPWVKIRLNILLEHISIADLAPDPVIAPQAERWTAKEAAEHEALVRREWEKSR